MGIQQGHTSAIVRYLLGGKKEKEREVWNPYRNTKKLETALKIISQL